MANKAVEFNKSLQGLSAEDLNARLVEEELRLKKVEFAHAISPLENPMTIRSLRRDIARIKTALAAKSKA
ncbi:50S ribosomal protein L29 [Rhizosphaericola mali]|uniref:Large ribosomal subunit protein uL29 n=1 Tax=Rhizosphaericola mali TaxID=2545455 RepID=A0A5P2G5P6_9BACT|nr:50S ribosomal protein L29 [Rhizosphaericola mali]QES90547.1 50S ribosomal protein L29 [Rhizosphaericola mali]